MALSEDPNLQPVLLGLFLLIYLVTVLGNLLIIMSVSMDSHLHKPMYFFLCNLSLADIGFISTTVPNLIVNIQTDIRVISYAGCLTQMSLFIMFGCLDDFLLAVMAYDRFVAICHPLHYQVIMNPYLCSIFLLVSFMLSLLDSQLHNLIVLEVSYCKVDNEIANFFCDPSDLLSIASSDTWTGTIVRYCVGAISGFLPIFGIIFSYCKIGSSILRVPSTAGKYKAFSTCGSHLTIVCLFYGTGLGSYLGSSVLPAGDNAMASVMYTIVTPMLNPFIYSLRNRDIQSALRKILSRIF